MSDMDYLFVMEDGGGWWLKIDSMEKLTDYFEHTLPGKYEGLSIYTDKPCLRNRRRNGSGTHYE